MSIRPAARTARPTAADACGRAGSSSAGGAAGGDGISHRGWELRIAEHRASGNYSTRWPSPG
jgi:hypothetical protein